VRCTSKFKNALGVLTSREKKRRFSLFLAGLVLCVTLTGCAGNTGFKDAFGADLPGLGVQILDEKESISYFASDLCVVNSDVEMAGVDTTDIWSACFFNIDSKEVLCAKNVHEQRYPASTTKIMTALVALKYGDLTEQAIVSQEAITLNDSQASTAKLKAGDVLTLQQLLYALLVVSANDAANVIAEKVGGSIDKFVEMMNEEAFKIGASNTHFVNTNGLHDDEHYTTVYDLYLMFQEALKYDIFLEIIKQSSYETTYLSGDGTSVEAKWKSTDRFTTGAVTVPEGVEVTAVGGKTGSTSAARSCLVQLFQDQEGQHYVAIILGCKERAILYEQMQNFVSGL